MMEGLLPVELTAEVLSWVPIQDIKHCLVVCKAFARALLDVDMPWRNRCVRDFRHLKIDSTSTPDLFYETSSTWLEVYKGTI